MAWAPDYVTAAELKAYLRISDTVDDVQIALAITAASRAVDRHTSRQFGLVAAPEARTYTSRWDRLRRRYVCDIDDLMTVTGLTITNTQGPVTGYTLKPGNAPAKGRPWTLLVLDPQPTIHPTPWVTLEDDVTVTARYGWTTVPDPVKQATLLQASRIVARRGAPFGVAGSPDLGNELRLLAKVDVDVAVVLGPYIRWWSAA
jgi:uncharacterized phiE125 gp8 family phage protein